MITPMDQVLVVGRRGLAKDVLSTLQRAQVVHVERLNAEQYAGALQPFQLSEDEAQVRDAWDSIVKRTTFALQQLGHTEEPAEVKAETLTDAAAARSEVEQIASQVGRLADERDALEDEADLTATWLPLLRTLAPLKAPVDESQYLGAVAFFAVDEDAAKLTEQLKAQYDGEFVLTQKNYNGQQLVVVTTLRSRLSELRAALPKLGYAELQLPEKYARQGIARSAHLLEERSSQLPRRLQAITDELNNLAERHAARLWTLQRGAANHQLRYEALDNTAAGSYGFALKGWVPSELAQGVVADLLKQYGEDIIVQTRPADQHADENVPVVLDNAPWVKPFELLLGIFAPPKYGAFDPSWTLAVFFPMFFGLIVGDFGYGLGFLLVAWLLHKRAVAGKSLGLGPLGITIPADSLKSVSTMIFWAGGWSVAFGLLFGEAFGNLAERFPIGKPLFYTTLHNEVGYGIFQIPIFRVEVFGPVLMMTIAFGVLQVVGGWIIRSYYGLKHGDMEHVYEGIGMAAGLLALVVFAYAYLNDLLGTPVFIIAGIGGAIFVVCTVLAKKPLMPIELIGNSGNILSYLRLFAVGLAAALVGGLATDLGFAIGGTLPIIGPILGIVIGFLVHLTAIVITLIGHTLQPLRLQYVEFFTKFGFYDASGRKYEPLKLLGGK